MNKKMTAVEWLAKEICYINDDGKYIVDDAEDVTHIVQKAKAMEKEQMENMYNHAMYALVDGNGHGQGFDEFYKETYEQE